MLKSYLKIALRNVKKYKGYSFINVTGLATGMACCILIFLWIQDELRIQEEEKESSFDFQFVKSRNPVIRNNNVVVNVRNQYGETLPFYTIPIGGVPKYEYDPTITELD